MLHARHLVAMFAAFLLLAGTARLAQAEDKAGDATGTWKWTTQGGGGGGGGGGGQPREFVLKLKQDGSKVTGTLNAFGNETEIKEGTIKDGTISFTTSRTMNDQTFTTKYNGKLEGDTIKGKTTSERNGQTRERDWEAKRAPDAGTTQPA